MESLYHYLLQGFITSPRWFSRRISSNHQPYMFWGMPKPWFTVDKNHSNSNFAPWVQMNYCLNQLIWVFPKIRGFPPKSSILIGFSIIFTIHFGVPLFLETSIFDSQKSECLMSKPVEVSLDISDIHPKGSNPVRCGRPSL